VSVSINIPDEIYEQASRMAEVHHIAVDDIFVNAFSEQFAAWQHVRERAARGDRDQFLAVLSEVPDVEPEAYDRILT
jgi:hypothetical protein